MCTLLIIFCNLSRKTFDCSRNYILRSSKLLFPCSEELSAKHSFPWKTYNVSINFCLEPIKLHSSAKSLQQNCENCIAWCPRYTPMKNSFTEKITILFKTFRILAQKQSRIKQNGFGSFIKNALSVSSKYFQVKSIGKMNTNLSIFVGFEQKLSRSLANLFRHTCQNCFSTVQQTFREKINLTKSIHFCPSFGALSKKKIGV